MVLRILHGHSPLLRKLILRESISVFEEELSLCSSFATGIHPVWFKSGQSHSVTLAQLRLTHRDPCKNWSTGARKLGNEKWNEPRRWAPIGNHQLDGLQFSFPASTNKKIDRQWYTQRQFPGNGVRCCTRLSRNSTACGEASCNLPKQTRPTRATSRNVHPYLG